MEQLKHFQTFPVLKTKRLTLRAIQLEDAEAIFKMRASGRVNQFIPRTNMQEKAAAEDLVKRTITAYSEGKAIGWAGVLRDQQTIIGTCGFNSIDFMNKRAEIGGEMAVEYWGKGIALEAVEAILKFGFDELHLHAIEAKVSPENKGAIHVLEQLGFQKEAHFKDRIYFKEQYLDMAIYTLFEK
jgi:[ribosomal protein S5]-alanine N-acetyltransferase